MEVLKLYLSLSSTFLFGEELKTCPSSMCMLNHAVFAPFCAWPLPSPGPTTTGDCHRKCPGFGDWERARAMQPGWGRCSEYGARTSRVALVAFAGHRSPPAEEFGRRLTASPARQANFIYKSIVWGCCGVLVLLVSCDLLWLHMPTFHSCIPVA